MQRFGRNLLAFVWPAPRGGDLLRASRERLLILFALIAGMGGTTTALSSLYLFAEQPLISAGGLVGALLLFAVPVHFHLTGAFRRSAWAMIALYVAPILFTILPTGGLLAGSSLYLLAAPIIAGLLLGLRAALAVGGGVFLAVVALYLWRDGLGEPVHGMDRSAMAYSFAYALGILVLGLAVAVGTFHRVMEATNLALKQARDEAESADAAKTQFLANMSHELRTPLNGILGFADLLSAMPLPPEAKTYLRHVRAAGGDLLSLVNDVLDFTRAAGGAMALEALAFDPHVLVDDLRARIGVRAEAKDLELEIRVADNVPHAVRGDPLRLRQVLGNLLDNAVKFTEAGRIVLDVSATTGPGEGAGETCRLRFEVRDSGPGIPAAALPTLFDRFTQADSSTTRRYGGSGLGLAIVRALVELMGGEVGVESTPGEGSLFHVTLSLPLATGLPAVEAGTAPPRRRAQHPGRILLVEDSETNQELFRAVLTGAGHVVEIAENGQIALDALKARSFDMVLMDGQMPVMGGRATSLAIRAADAPYSRLPIIAITADALAGQDRNYRSAGMNDYLAKPVEPLRMLAKIDLWMGRQVPATIPPPAQNGAPTNGTPENGTPPAAPQS